ncbi:MAG: type I restriction endonuclease subunit R [Nitrospinota bacterium]|nr:type I restriction endonuclease subunit R [Nitrospinota bacterium]
MTIISESTIEEANLEWLEELGFERRYGPDISPDGDQPGAERASFEDVILRSRLEAALARINPDIPPAGIEEAIRKITTTDSPLLIENNRRFHRQITDGVDVEYSDEGGAIKYDKVWLFDFDEPGNNDWLAVNQFTVIENKHNRRPDIVVFINGLPLVVIELKNMADEKATVRGAFNQLQTYKADIPSLFHYNAFLVISDGQTARFGSVTANWERFMPWRTIDGKDVAPKGSPELEVLLKGMFDKRRLLDLIRHFIVYEVDGEKIAKKIAGYHQYHAVNMAVEETVRASRSSGDRRVGVVWHTQGSGKSLTMTFYAGKIIQRKEMQNPTVVVLTDRNDLDDQLFGVFARCGELIRQTPVQAENRERLKELLKVASGGVVFTTIQKFAPEGDSLKHPLLSDRRNIVFIADEAHRSQYDFIDGFAKHMRDALPKASFIGFTGTPIELSDKNTKAVFGDYIHVYDIQRAVEDGATVRIYYEARLAKMELLESEKPKIDPEFEEVTEDLEEGEKSKLRTKWARLEAMVGSEKRIKLIAKDIVTHYENRQDVMDGKGLIVCMSRRICVDLYSAIAKLRPEWADEDDHKGQMKVIMTGSASDKLEWQQHIRDKRRREVLAESFKDEKSPFKLAIVRDMWLTGFDVPCLHTMYLDKPMRGHGLMQAIARVNRVFKDKPGGLVVDYLGLAEDLKRAMADYSKSDQDMTGIPQDVAVNVMREKYEIVKALFHGFDHSGFVKKKASMQTSMITNATQHILGQENGKNRLLKHVTELSKAFALAVPHEDALAIRDDVGFFQAVRAAVAKNIGESGDDGKAKEDLDVAVRQIVSRAIASDEVIDIFKSAGMKRPDISILSDEFLEEVRRMPQRNVAMELLKRLLNDEIKIRSRRNLVQSRKFLEMLESTIRRYQNRTIEAAQVIAELIDMAKDIKKADKRGADLGLSDDELAFYEAVSDNGSAREILGDEVLRAIAHDLVETVRKNTTIDWAVRESVRAKMRVMIKRILKKHGYPPDKQEKATIILLEQAELLSQELVA